LSIIYRAKRNEHSHTIAEGIFAYEISFSTLQPGEKWRTSHRTTVLTTSPQSAIARIGEHYAGEIVIDQVILRNKSQDVIVDLPETIA